MVNNQNSNAQVTSVLHVLNDCDAVGDMHFIEDRDYFMKIAKKEWKRSWRYNEIPLILW